jgi:hypothetical protein
MRKNGAGFCAIDNDSITRPPLRKTIRQSRNGIAIAAGKFRIFDSAEGQAMELVYRSCRVRTIPELNVDADCWIPKADVSWEEKGAPRHQTLTGQSDIFKILEEAEIYAVEMAKAWIDVEFPRRLTSDQCQ